MERPQDIRPAQQNPVELVLSASDTEMVNRGPVSIVTKYLGLSMADRLRTWSGLTTIWGRALLILGSRALL